MVNNEGTWDKSQKIQAAGIYNTTHRAQAPSLFYVLLL